jgi:hypothetical protein
VYVYIQLAEVEKRCIDILGPDDVLDHIYWDPFTGLIVAGKRSQL